MEYSACIIVEGWVEVVVDAKDDADAHRKMEEALERMNYGELRDAAWVLDDAEIHHEDAEEY